MGNASIRIGILNGKLILENKMENLNQAEMAMLIANIQVLSDELIVQYKKSLKTFNGK